MPLFAYIGGELYAKTSSGDTTERALSPLPPHPPDRGGGERGGRGGGKAEPQTADKLFE
jgi:hypothetical protein